MKIIVRTTGACALALAYATAGHAQQVGTPASQARLEAALERLERQQAQLESQQAELARQAQEIAELRRSMVEARASDTYSLPARAPDQPNVAVAEGVARDPQGGPAGAQQATIPLERVGQAPEDVDRPIDLAVLDMQGSAVTRRGQIAAEFQYEYTRADRSRAVFRGVELVEAVLVGVFDINESRQDILGTSVGLRYGLTDRLESITILFSATARRTMSLSVTIPTSLPSLTTGKAPTSCSRILRAASASVVSGVAVRTDAAMIRLTFIKSTPNCGGECYQQLAPTR